MLPKTSVGYLDPQDPHVFVPPGSGPVVNGMDPDPAPDMDPSLYS
jgi:hypothetical protein